MAAAANNSQTPPANFVLQFAMRTACSFLSIVGSAYIIQVRH